MDDTFEEINTYRHNLLKAEFDSDADDTADILWTYQYDADGILEQREADVDVDGSIDVPRYYTYDDYGNLFTVES